ncbi:ComF family protein [Ignatzschineria sp. LJL83]
MCHFCKKIFPKLESTSISFRYDAGIRSLIQQLKFSLKPYIAKIIAEIIWEKHHEFILMLPSNTTIIPMPSGRLRMAKRGYNPVSLIARELAKLSKLSFAEHYLLKSAFSIPQVELSRQERLDNHHNSFRLNPYYQDSQLPIENILLIDDVITTGRSFEKAVEKLHESNAKQIFGLLIAQS